MVIYGIPPAIVTDLFLIFYRKKMFVYNKYVHNNVNSPQNSWFAEVWTHSQSSRNVHTDDIGNL